MRKSLCNFWCSNWFNDLVSVTDGNGCSSAIVGNASINTYAVPVMNVRNDQEICEGLNLNVSGIFC
ncbi:MAG: hypothetical protein IPM77_16230 [Crocinitomicaceae bacterium]|nr:hypothetical protein [Crocinitomicaceae bacterium]